jgi:hypothetical protein
MLRAAVMLIAAFNQGALAAKIYSEKGGKETTKSKAKENPCKTAQLRVDDHFDKNFELPLGEMVYVPS